MKLYLNLTTDENRKMWPALMMSMYDDVEHIIAHHYASHPDKGPVIRQAAVAVLMPIMEGMSKLQDTLLEFHFDKSDQLNGVIDETVDIFAVDANAASIRDQWAKDMRARPTVQFEDSVGDQHVINLKEEEIENFIELADTRVKELTGVLWSAVAEEIKSVTLRFTFDVNGMTFAPAEGGKESIHLHDSNVDLELSPPTADAVEELKEKLNKDE